MLSKQRNVFVLQGAGTINIQEMFASRGYNVVDDILDSDLVVFSGGEDVSPELYGEFIHVRTHHNPERDEAEQGVFSLARALGLPMVGICRGGQFLNVMNGGKCYQDVDGHAIHGTHVAKIVGNLVPVEVSSTHHQMMRPNYDPAAGCHLLMTANISTTRRSMSDMSSGVSYETVTKKSDERGYVLDVEAVYYESTNSLCFQPHPEFSGPLYEDCRKVFFSFIENYLFDEEDRIVPPEEYTEWWEND